MQHEDGGLLMHGTVVRHKSDYHHGRSYRIRVFKDGQHHHQDKQTYQMTLTTVEEYLKNEVAEDKMPEANRHYETVDITESYMRLRNQKNSLIAIMALKGTQHTWNHHHLL